jgi:hypothetical protein
LPRQLNIRRAELDPADCERDTPVSVFHSIDAYRCDASRVPWIRGIARSTVAKEMGIEGAPLCGMVGGLQ